MKYSNQAYSIYLCDKNYDHIFRKEMVFHQCESYDDVSSDFFVKMIDHKLHR